MDDDERNEKTQVVIPKDIVTAKTDRRGRFTLGNLYANKTVRVAVIEVED